MPWTFLICIGYVQLSYSLAKGYVLKVYPHAYDYVDVLSLMLLEFVGNILILGEALSSQSPKRKNSD